MSDEKYYTRCAALIHSLVSLLAMILIAIFFRPLGRLYFSERVILVVFNIIGLSLGLLVSLIYYRIRELRGG